MLKDFNIFLNYFRNLILTYDFIRKKKKKNSNYILA